MVEMVVVVVTSLLTSSPLTPALSDTLEGGPQSPQHAPGHPPRGYSTSILRRYGSPYSSFPFFSLSTRLSQNNHFHKTAFASGSPCFLEVSVEFTTPERTSPRTWTVPTTVPNNPSAGKSRRGALGCVHCPLELLSWSLILYCMTLHCVISSHSCEGPSCQETDTERNNVGPRMLRLQLKS